MTEPTEETIINEKVKPTVKPFSMKKDLSSYGSQEDFDKAIEDLLKKDYVPCDTASSNGDFVVFMIQAFTHKKKILMLLGDNEESVQVGTLKRLPIAKESDSEKE